LKSRLSNIRFVAVYSASWRSSGAEFTPHTEAAIVTRLACDAEQATRQWEPEDVHAAQDAANLVLGNATDLSDIGVFGLTGSVRLWLTEEDAAGTRAHRADLARLSRLRFLRRQLYGDPEMILVDQLDRRPQDAAGMNIKELQQLARAVRVGGEVWYPLLQCLEAMTAKVTAKDPDIHAMKMVFKVLRETMPELITAHGLDAQADLLLDGFENGLESP
jgi:hypothetical protein